MISNLAGGQWGLLTTKQAAEHGVSRVQLARLADAGMLERVQQGVYALTSSTDRFQTLHAAWLSLAPGFTAEQRVAIEREAIVASHTSAAHLHGMGDLLHDVPEFNTDRRKQTVRGMRLHRLRLSLNDVVLVDGLPTTSPERTIADLIRGRHDLTHVADAIRDGLSSGILDTRPLRFQLDQVARRTGYQDGEDLLEYLLDLVGLSATALMKSTAESPLGKVIAASAVEHYRNGLLEQINKSVLNDESIRAIRSAAIPDTNPEILRAIQTAAVPDISPWLRTLRNATVTDIDRGHLQATRDPAAPLLESLKGGSDCTTAPQGAVPDVDSRAPAAKKPAETSSESGSEEANQ